MILVVQGVTEIGVEWVDVVEAGEVCEHCCEAFRDCLLCEFDFTHAVELGCGENREEGR